MSNFKDLYEFLRLNNQLRYGQVILAKTIRDFMGIDLPEIGTKKDFDQASLAELGCVDYVRNILLGHGMYLAQSKGDYRILLPSENNRQVELYISSADKKLSRALKLSRNSPHAQFVNNDQTEARIVMKRQDMRRSL